MVSAMAMSFVLSAVPSAFADEVQDAVDFVLACAN